VRSGIAFALKPGLAIQGCPSPRRLPVICISWPSDVWGMVGNGKFYAWAPPGWPLLLASGILLQVPRRGNPVISAPTLLSVYDLGRLVYNTSVALLAVFFMLFSPFFLLHSAADYAHSNSLFFITLFVFSCAQGIERKANREFSWAGRCGSMSSSGSIQAGRAVCMKTTRQGHLSSRRSVLTRPSRPAADRRGGPTQDGSAHGRRHPHVA
jgi:hypothetical protein